ncbi:MAG: hypothetical protein IPK95_06990 [Cellvibrionales bacterium]|nr:hypothetical protein [Cellvibrionales bacterium]
MRLATLEEAGKQHVPFTTGILIGIGETRRAHRITVGYSRTASTVRTYPGNHRTEFPRETGLKMAEAPEPDLEELLWTLAVTRIIWQ